MSFVTLERQLEGNIQKNGEKTVGLELTKFNA
jgi:hypothetical protein